MKFGLIDRVLEVEPGKRIVAVKAVTLGEEYLAEHFPTFPVLPGVFMLEAMVEAARWLVHATDDFAHSVVLLKRARGITYKSFVAPGQLLRVEITCTRLDPATEHSSEACGSMGIGEFKGTGHCGETEVVKGRFSLNLYNLADQRAGGAEADRLIVEQARAKWSLIKGQST